MKQADLWEKLDGGKVRCRLCAHGCVIGPEKRGICQVRENRGGALYTLVWGRPVAASADPIEKKPLYHFLPASKSFSIATVGCNFRCAFCQNWQISQQQIEDGGPIPGGGPGGMVMPKEIVEEAVASGCKSMSYTYTEPTVFFEYARDCMKLAVEAGLKNVFVTNGYESAVCLDACKGLLHAANVDLKAFNDAFYKTECQARLQPVLDTLKRMHQAGVWVEVTTLLIPGRNDDPGELKDLAGFIAGELSPNTPWHISAYTPRYKYSNGGPVSTSVASLERALNIGREAGLRHVYTGNVPGHESSDTRCPACNDVVIKRQGFYVGRSELLDGKCASCGAPVAGVWR